MSKSMQRRSFKLEDILKKEPEINVAETDVTEDTIVPTESENIETPLTITPNTYNLPRKFAPDELIPCVSITSGKLMMPGVRTGMLYTWADKDDVQGVEYQDLIFAVRSKSNFVFKPRFIIDDEEFLEQNSSVIEVYESMYSMKDIKDILSLPARDMKAVIVPLPDGVKDSIKSTASTMIMNGTLDSVSKIKALDEIFNTNLMAITNLNN